MNEAETHAEHIDPALRAAGQGFAGGLSAGAPQHQAGGAGGQTLGCATDRGRRLIEADDSDLFDVLAYVAFAAAPVTRVARVAQAAGAHAVAAAADAVTDKQRGFVDFVLAQYLRQMFVGFQRHLYAAGNPLTT